MRYLRFLASGQLKEICYHNSGKIQGKYIKYYDNGNIHIECEYFNGKKNGIMKIYNKELFINTLYSFYFFILLIYNYNYIFNEKIKINYNYY